jgi:hypothetical protein|tara:strand:- start:1129 stop:1509 length:381 start_codon:yes stop_codon:yes gene_type:complete
MSNSLVKFTNQKDGNGRGNLYWNRADLDGLPFRGHTPPSFRSEEFEERVVRVADPKNGTFYTGDEEQNKDYLKVMDGITNGWYHMLFIERWREEGDKNHHVYVEWVEYFLEDGNPTPFQPGPQTGM